METHVNLMRAYQEDPKKVQEVVIKMLRDAYADKTPEWNPICGHAWVVVCPSQVDLGYPTLTIERMFNDEKQANEYRYMLEEQYPQSAFEVVYYDIYK